MLKRFLCIGFMISTVAFPHIVRGAIRIQEIYPAPASGGDEWVELYNDSETDVAVEGYAVTDAKGNEMTISPGSIPQHATTIAVSKNVLNNDGDAVHLSYHDMLIDSVTYAVQLDSSAAYIYCPDKNPAWIVGAPTRDAVNGPSCQYAPSATPIVVQTPTATSIPEAVLSGIVVSEIMANPYAEEPEWVELYNGSDGSVTLDITIDDDNGSGPPVPAHLDLAARAYAVAELPVEILNNDGDTVQVRAGSYAFHSVHYPTLPKGSSWGRGENDSFCIMAPSKGTVNGACIAPTTPSIAAPTRTPTPKHTTTPANAPTATSVPKETLQVTLIKRRSPSIHMLQTVSDVAEASAGGSVKGTSDRTKPTEPSVAPILLLITAGGLAAIAGTVIILKIKHRIGGY